MMHFHIQPTDKTLSATIQDKIDNLNKPKGSLGRLESLAHQLCLIQGTLTPHLNHPCHVLFGGDHGIEREGVSVSPREVTWQQMVNFSRGGGGVNMFCRQHGFTLRLVDAGVDHDLSDIIAIIPRKVGFGTRNFLHEPAMTREEMLQCLATGREMTDQCHGEGCNVISFGEMGIANTSPSSIWMHFLENIPLDRCIGAGAGLSDEGIRHKMDILSRSVVHFTETTGIASPAPLISDFQWSDTPCSSLHIYSKDTLTELLRGFGGFEMVAAVGGMLRGAELGMTVLIDGFIMTACAMMAIAFHPEARDYFVFTHSGDETGHDMMLRHLHAEPLLRLGLRLGEGTGALCAYPLLVSAVNMVNEMDNFQHARITKYF